MPFKMMGKSPLTKKLIGNQHRLPAELKAKIQASPEPGSSPAKIIPLLAGKAAALIGKKLLAKGVAKAGAKAAAKAGTKAATKKASGKLMEKSGKSLIDNEDNIRSKMKSKMQNKDEEDKKAPTTSLSSSNPYANQNTALQMKGKKPSPAKKEKDPKSVSGSSGELSKRLKELRKNPITTGEVGDMSSFANMFRSTSGAYDGATKIAKEEAKKTSSDTGSDTPAMKPIERAFQERGAAIIKRGQEKGNQRAYDRAKRKGYDAEAVTGLTKGRGPKSGSDGKTSRSINRQITKSEKSDDKVAKQSKRQEERTKRVALRNAPKSPKAKKADKVVKADKAIPNPTKGQEKGQGIIEKVTVEKTSKPNPVENAYTPPTKKQKNKKAKSDSRIESKRIRRLKNKETGKRIKRGESIGDGTRGISKDSESYREDQTKRQALKAEKQKRKNIGKSPAEMKTKTPNKMMKKAPNKMMKKAPSKMMKKAPAKMMKKAPAKMMKKKSKK